MAVSLKASKRGLEIIDAARLACNWTKAAVEWREAAQVAKASLDRFWLGRAIKKESFMAICQAVGVDWQEVADLQPKAASSLESQELEQVSAIASPSFAPPALQIDWHSIAVEMLTPQKRLTTNSLMARDGLTFDLEQIYVPQFLSEQRQRATIQKSHLSVEQGSQLYNPYAQECSRLLPQHEFFQAVLKQGNSPQSQGRRLALVGEPGTGKTTLLQKIAGWVLDIGDIPIWVSLADCAGRTLEEYLLQVWLKDALKTARVTPEMEDALVELCKSDRVWLLLDGADEMVVGAGSPLTAIASQLTGWVGRSRSILTCRLNIWDTGKNALENFDVYRHLDFSCGENHTPDLVSQFISHWFAKTPELGNQLRSELAQPGRELIQDLVKNPLRLSLLCRIWARRQGGLPDSKIALYEQFVTALYEWKQEIFPTSSQERQELNKALGMLALQAIARERTNFRLKHSLVCQVLGEPDTALFQLALQIGWLNRVGVAAENPEEPVYAFFHPSFQEYFAAQAIADFEDFPLDILFEVQWEEIILYWLDREDGLRSQKLQLIDTLIARMTESSDEDIRWQIARSLGVIGIDSPDVVNALIELLDTSQNEYTICQAATSLGRIDPGNSKAINALIELLNASQDEDIKISATKSLLDHIGAINPDAAQALNYLMLEFTQTQGQSFMSLFDFFKKISRQDSESQPQIQPFVLEPILLDDHLDCGLGNDVLNENVVFSESQIFEPDAFIVGENGEVSISFLFDGGAYQTGQIADVIGDGNTFVLEDLRTDGTTDRDYNDIIFQADPLPVEFPPNQPLIGIINTGFNAYNPDIDYSHIILGNGDDVISDLGQASQEFDNIITVGVAKHLDLPSDRAVPIALAYARTDYSSYGYGLDILADGGTVENPNLTQLLLEAKQYPPRSVERNRALTQLMNAIMECDEFGSKGQVPDDIYHGALKKVLMEISQQINNYDSTQQGDGFTWIDFLLNQHLIDQEDRDFEPESNQSSGKIDSPASQSENCLDLPPEVVQCLKSERETWQKIQMRDRPDINFYLLAERRAVGQSWQEIAKFWKIPIAKLATFYQRYLAYLTTKFKKNSVVLRS